MTRVEAFAPAGVDREIEERSLNAWPALRRVFVDGWILGLSEGYTRRANSVNPIYEGVRSVADKVPLCEAVFADHGLPSVFKVTPKGVETGLDGHLAANGYGKYATTRVQVLTLNALREMLDGDVEVMTDIDDGWMSDYGRMKEMSDAETEKNRVILDRIGLPIRYVSIVQDGRRAAAGIGVIEGGWVGLFGIVTDPSFRRRGLGGRLTRALAAAGAEKGARAAYLQVEAANAGAVALYRSVGFQDAYEYWYRERHTTAITNVRVKSEANGDSQEGKDGV